MKKASCLWAFLLSSLLPASGLFLPCGRALAACAPVTATVTTTAGDQSAGSLGDAINQIDANPCGGVIDLSPISGGTINLTSSLPAVSQSVTILGSGVTVNGSSIQFFDVQSGTVSVAGLNFSGAMAVSFGGAGTDVAVSGPNAYIGGTSVAGTAVLSVAADNSLGAASTTLTLDGADLRTTAGVSFNSGRSLFLTASGGAIDTNGFNSSWNGVISGTGMLEIEGGGALTLTGANTYTGGTCLEGGTLLNISDDANLGSPTGPVTGWLMVDGGTLQSAVSVLNSDWDRPLILGPGGAVVDVHGLGNFWGRFCWNGPIEGSGGLTVTDTTGNGGVFAVYGLNSYTGFTEVTPTGAFYVYNPLWDHAAVNVDGYLYINLEFISTTLTLGSLSGSSGGIVDLEYTALTVGTNDQSTTFYGILRDEGLFDYGLNKVGTGTLALRGVNGYNGGTTLVGGVLNIVSDVNLGASTGNLAFDGGTLQTSAGVTSARTVYFTANGGTFDSQTYDSYLTGVLSGPGGLTKTGTGTLTLDGINTYTGGTLISDGILMIGDSNSVTAQIQGPVSVASGAVLAGYGSILGLVTNNGTVALAGAPDVLSAASYDQTAAGSLQVEVAPGDFQSGTLAVVDAQLDGSVTVLADPGSYGVRYKYVILSASNSLAGTFSGITDNLSYMDSTLAYGVDAVTLTLTRNNADFGAWAFGANQASVAAALNQSLSTASDALATKMNELYVLPSGQSAALGEMAGQVYTALPSVVLGHSLLENDLLFSRLSGEAPTGGNGLLASLTRDLIASEVQGDAGHAAGLSVVPENGFWIRNTDSVGVIFASSDVTGFNTSDYGFLGGYDAELTPGFTLGLMGGYVHMDATASDSQSRTGVDSYQGGLYGRKTFGPLAISAVAGYGVDRFQANRAMRIGSDVTQVAGAADGSQWEAALQGDYLLELAGSTFRPLARVEFTRLSENAFTETGSDSVNLSLPAQTYDSLRSSLGVNWSKSYGLGGDAKVIPAGSLIVTEEFLNPSAQYQATLGGAPSNSFTVKGIQAGKTDVGLGIGFQFLFGDRFSLVANGNSHLSGSQFLANFNGGASLAF